MELFIKKAGISEIPIIYDITKEAFKKYAMDLGLPSAVSALHETFKDIKNDIEEKTILVAYYKGEPVGSIRYEMVDDSTVYITRFGVKAKAQGCGIGKALIDEVVNRAQKIGAHMITLHTASKVMPLIKFYYSLGFYIHSTTTDRGYVRALLCKELVEYTDVPIMSASIK
ncbi:MAG: GNAT family N-acetyltransferase [Clostridiales bacterium]|nr:GNAT family N-acetyltransferase [Clostridiales bacterium]